jgi:ribonuclease BN (tRNA processing enzyme)
MKVTFIGVGEAFDETLPNNSQYIEAETSGGPVRVLVDCGFNVPFAFWRTMENPAELDHIYITHFHGDHCFGLPALLLKLRDVNRTRPLSIIGRPGIQDKCETLMREAYAGLFDTLGFPIMYHAMAPKTPLALPGCSLTCAKSEHGQDNFALRMDADGKSVFSSGDGHPTEDTLKLAKGCDLAVHEAYGLEKDTPGHGSVPGAIEFARKAGVKRLALTHIRADVRREHKAEILAQAAKAQDVGAFVPEPGDTVAL